MGFGKLPVVLAGGVSLALLARFPASASTSTGDPGATRFDVTRVKLVKGGSAAKVRFTVLCPAGQTFSVNVDVRQDSDGTAPLDAFYTTTRKISGDCTGTTQRFKVVATPEPLGLYAPADGRLQRCAPTIEVIWGRRGDQAFAQEDDEPIKGCKRWRA